jgi:hypothetical protein
MYVSSFVQPFVLVVFGLMTYFREQNWLLCSKAIKSWVPTFSSAWNYFCCYCLELSWVLALRRSIRFLLLKARDS